MNRIKKILKIEKSNRKRQVQASGLFFYDYYMPNLVRFLFNVLVQFLSPLLYILLRVGKKRVRLSEPKYTFSVCAIFKNEDLSLKEWIEYHLNIGVEHFYLYNNNSTDSFELILEPYVKNDIVTLISWPLAQEQQMPAYSDCFDRFKNETKWLAYIDLDEFICPFYETDIKKWIGKFSNYPSVYIYWKMFGTSGIIEHNKEKLIIEQYISCWDKYYDIGKSIINTQFEVLEFDKKYTHTMFGSVKIFNYRIPMPPINEFKKFVLFEINRSGLFNKNFSIQLNHYYSKSYIEYMDKKKARGDVALVGDDAKNLKSDEVFFYFQNQCTSVDYKIYRFINELKISMGYTSK
ncbi:hypothetical protein HYN56_24655 [Flavobacterium crocinum]|uniref:Glycosyl transferase n=1 Tax=Flavobacterium crocinum TaxID=2183896 RepID=A0A2S1YT40_9FLAO|nr:glycosyltransferase family 92 protein [Flavobacterium crocinum]AWK07245.1 hypothetical protein HYN56_24655 [Flavobacterium crocinum]